MLCDTRLNDSIFSSEIFPSNFIVYRCDRSKNTEIHQKKKRPDGGGVLIAVEKSLKSKCIGNGEIYGAEQIWVKVKLKHKSLIFIQLYIRPDSLYEVYDANMNALKEVVSNQNPEDIIILSGDFILAF